MDPFGVASPVVVESGSVNCATVLDTLATLRAMAPNPADGDAWGPVSVGAWTCQSGPSDDRWTVCNSGSSAVAMGATPPTPWSPFNPHGGLTPQFYYDAAGIITQYPSEAGYGTSACHTTISTQANPSNAPTAAQLGVSVTASAVHVDQSGGSEQVVGTVTITNVTQTSVTLTESDDIAADQLMDGDAAASPAAGWDGPLLGLREVTLAPGASTSAEHLLPAYTCAGDPVAAGTYTAQFAVGLQVSVSGAQLDYALPAGNAPSVTLP